MAMLDSYANQRTETELFWNYPLMPPRRPQTRPQIVAADLPTASYQKIRDHIVYELGCLLDSVYDTQRHLGQAMGYMTGSQVSQIMSRQKDLSVAKARTLDENSRTGKTTIGTSFYELALECEKSKIRRQRVAIPTRADYDIFLASPMAAAGPRYESQRSDAMTLARAMAAHGETVYCAAESIATTRDFDLQEVAYSSNFDAIRKSRTLVLYLPTPPTQKPSSVWVEIGMALALGMPCTLFVPDNDSLPYILQQANISNENIVSVYLHGTNSTQPLDWVLKNGVDFLAGFKS